MTVDFHAIFNALLGLVSAVLGWFSRELWQAVQSLRRDLSELEVRIVRDYVRYDRLQDAIEPVLEALHRLEAKIDGKVDKEKR